MLGSGADHAAAMAFFENLPAWGVGAGDIDDPRCTPDVCHTLTLGHELEHGHEGLLGFLEEFGALSSPPRILICLEDDRLAHTATWVGADRWRQTLPGGPIFITTRAQLEGVYGADAVFDTGVPSENEAVMAMGAGPATSYGQRRDELLAALEPYTQMPEDQLGDRGSLSRAFKAWHAELLALPTYSTRAHDAVARIWDFALEADLVSHPLDDSA